MNMNKEINLPQKVEILRTFKHLGIVEVTSKTQKKNGTRRFRMPWKLDGRENVEFAVYKSGYVRKTKGFVFTCYQINQTRFTYFNFLVKTPEERENQCGTFFNVNEEFPIHVSNCSVRSTFLQNSSPYYRLAILRRDYST